MKNQKNRSDKPPPRNTLGDAPVTREALYELVWAEPMLKVAARFGVSSSYMARVCSLLKVPRPERGYWAKLAVGKAPKRPELPEPCPGDMLEWARDGALSHRARALPKRPDRKRPQKRNLSAELPAWHPMVEGAKPLFEAGRLAYQGRYLKPAKKLLIDLTVTKSGLDKTLTFANQLFLAFEARGHRVMIAPNNERFHRAGVDERENPAKNPGYNNLWSPMRCTVVYIGTVAIGLTIVEMSEQAEARYINGEYVLVTEHSPKRRGRYAQDMGWRSTHDFPTGRLYLQAYSPYPRTNWSRQWRETEKRDLSDRIPTITRELSKAADEIAQLAAEGERQAEVERQRWQLQMATRRREQAERDAAKALKDSKDELLEIIEAWAAAEQLEAFFADAESRAQELSHEPRKLAIERLRQARDLIGSTDALARLTSWKTPRER